MAIYPKAIKRLIAPGSNDPRIKATAVCLHVAVSTADSLHDQFEHDGGIESHFYVRFDGTVEQYRDTAYQADAQAAGNDTCISVETEGMGAGQWTAAQLAAIKDLILWAHETHDVPLRKIQHWNGAGVGYHRQFPQWNPNGHTCPGPDRIKQFDQVLVPWIDAQAKAPAKPAAKSKPKSTSRGEEIDASLKELGDVGDHLAKAKGTGRRGEKLTAARKARSALRKALRKIGFVK